MIGNVVYLDNSSTTAVCRQAAAKAQEMMCTCFGNPSSLHTLGILAEREREAARAILLKALGDPAGELIFTSGGTEANNLAVLGGAALRQKQGRHVVTSMTEHPSVAQAFDRLEEQGFTVERLKPDESGAVPVSAVEAACRPDTVLCSLMLVNNETGAVNSIEQIVPLVRKRAPLAMIHCDGVQAFGKMPFSVKSLGVDALTVSGHKIYAPKGIGALYLKKGVRVRPQLYGGPQEKERRAGTENLPGIAAFGAAAAALPPVSGLPEKFLELKTRLLTGIRDIEGAVPHLPQNHAPHIVNISFVGLQSETLLHFLAGREIYVSSGSACAKGRLSPVLTAMGLPKEQVNSAIRISLSHQNTPEEIDRLLVALHEGADVLIRKK